MSYWFTFAFAVWLMLLARPLVSSVAYSCYCKMNRGRTWTKDLLWWLRVEWFAPQTKHAHTATPFFASRYYHCQGYATAETNPEYLNREPTKFHWVFCNQWLYALGTGIWILFGYHRGYWSSGTQPRRQPQNPGICNEMSHHVTNAEFKFRSASIWR